MPTGPLLNVAHKGFHSLPLTEVELLSFGYEDILLMSGAWWVF